MPCRFLVVTILLSLVAGTVWGDTGPATLNGKVVDGDGNGVQHATVLVYEAQMRRGYSVYCPTCWVDCGKRTTTGPEGRYSLTGLNSDLVFKLLVVKNGYKAVFVNKVDPLKADAHDAVLPLKRDTEDPSQTVRGRVTDAFGGPVRDAVVEQQGVTYKGPRGVGRAFGPNESPDWIQPLAATNERGEFEIVYAKPAVQITLMVSPRAMAPKLVTLPTGLEEKTISVTRGASIRGRLLKPDGSAAANAEVGVFTHSRSSGTVFQEVRIGTRTDGTFEISNIPAGRIWSVYPKMESLAASGLAGDAVTVETKDDGEVVDLGVIKLSNAYSLRGKLVMTDGKAISPEMHVTLSSDAGFDSQIATVSADGSFEFQGLSTGVYSISPGVRGYKPPDDFYGEVLVNRDRKSIVVPMIPAPSH